MRRVDSSLRWEKENPGKTRLSIPKSRAVVRDLLYFERSIPTFPHYRELDLGEVDSLRKHGNHRISWTVIFLKAYGLVARENPVLRQSLVQFPWPYLYQHPHSVGYLAIRRQEEEEEWLLFGSFPKPEEAGLDELQNRLERYQTEPIESVFRTLYGSASLPLLLRRTLIWFWLYWHGPRRAKRLGTFGLTTISSRGAVIQYPPGLPTVTMTYGPIDDSGKSRVTLNYDHRLMDGWYIAEVLEALESVIQGAIADELRSLQS